MSARPVAIGLAAAALAGCGGGGGGAPLPARPVAMHLASSAFPAGGTIPRDYTCDGDGRPVPLRWTGVPRDTVELVLTMEDPDAPGGTFLHWSVFGLSPRLHDLDPLPPAALQGRNSFGRDGYGGPCPPRGKGPHRYVFTLYALRSASGLGADAKRDAVRRALVRAAVAEGRLEGLYARK